MGQSKTNTIMENYAELEKATLMEGQKEMPRHIDFLNHVFKELQDFDVEKQVDILQELYHRLKAKYTEEMEINLKRAEEFKSKLNALKRIEPNTNLG